MTLAIRLTLVAWLVLLGLLVQFVRTERYRTTVLVADITLADAAPQRFPFDVDRAHDYLVEIWLDSLLPAQDLPSSEESELDVRWQILDGDVIVERGSGQEQGPSIVTTRRRRGRIIGEAALAPERDYTLVLEVVGGDPSWDRARPQVDVIVHPAVYEQRLFRQAALLMSNVAAAAVLVVLLVARSRRKADGPPEAPDAISRR